MRSKFKPVLVIDADHIKLIARFMPTKVEELGNIIPQSIVDSCGDEILKVTRNHERDQESFEECVLEIGSLI